MADDATSRLEVADILALDEALQRSTGSEGYGLQPGGFVPKPFARLLAEKLALARALFGNELDLGSGSAIRKLLEVSALEDARTWSALSAMYDNQFVSTARGEALSRLGEELGLPRPFLEARGTLRLTASLPTGVASLVLPRGARLLTEGLHHVALDSQVVFKPGALVQDAPVVAFYPGPSHNLDPSLTVEGRHPQRISRWNPDDPRIVGTDEQPGAILAVAKQQTPRPALEEVVRISHTTRLRGGELTWPDARYRELLLRAPRSIWSTDAIAMAVSRVPGVRQVKVRDIQGMLDVNASIFGNFDFAERVFGAQRDLGSPYYFDIIVAPDVTALWAGPDGIQASILAAIEDLRPIGIFPRVTLAEQAFIGLSAELSVSGLPLPRDARGAVISDSAAAANLKQRLLSRVARYVDGLGFGEPVRYAEVMWALMNEPGISDVQGLRLLRFPPEFPTQGPLAFPVGANVHIQPTEIASLADDDTQLRIV